MATSLRSMCRTDSPESVSTALTNSDAQRQRGGSRCVCAFGQRSGIEHCLARAHRSTQDKSQSSWQSLCTGASIFSIEAAFSLSHHQPVSHRNRDVWSSHDSGLLLVDWNSVFIAPCFTDYTQFLGNGLCLVPACCEDGDCIVTPALFMLVVARNAMPCLAAAGVRRFPSVSSTRSCAR